MRLAGLAALAFIASGVMAPAAHSQSIPCTCRSTDGSDVELGKTACIRSPQGMTLARCEKVLNNTSWKFLNQPCPGAALPAPMTGLPARG